MANQSPAVILKHLINEQILEMQKVEFREDGLPCHNYALGALNYARDIDVINKEQYDQFRMNLDEVTNLTMDKPSRYGES